MRLPRPMHDSVYTQTFSFDILGNMTKKLSEETVYPQKSIGDGLNYEHDYVYVSGFAHRLDHISDRYYRYDLNGNMTAEQFGAFSDDDGASDNGSGGTSSSSGMDSDDDGDGWDWDDDWQGGSGVIYSGGGTGCGTGSGNASSGSGSSGAGAYRSISISARPAS